MENLEFDHRLMEEAVGLAMRDRPESPYWEARERIYEEEDPEVRDREFLRLHRLYSDRLGMGAPVREALLELPILSRETARCRVIPARNRRDEGAELYVREPDGTERSAATRSIFVRLRPGAFLDPGRLLVWLRRELLHIADMVDPAFRYDPTLPQVDGGATRLKLVLDRYRVLWDATIDGRLSRRGQVGEEVRESRFREFSRTFSMLGAGASRAFDRWFQESHPTHEDLFRFALEPGRAVGSGPGICPLCRCPGDVAPGAGGEIPESVQVTIREDFPKWGPSDGICPQCLELYLSRGLSLAEARRLPGSQPFA